MKLGIVIATVFHHFLSPVASGGDWTRILGLRMMMQVFFYHAKLLNSNLLEDYANAKHYTGVEIFCQSKKQYCIYISKVFSQKSLQ